MKTKLFSIVIAMVAVMTATSIQAQVQTATLQHNDTLTVFRGEESLINAYDYAVDGDTIYLSPGTFKSSIRLYKSIVIQGYGLRSDASFSIRQTALNGSIQLCGESWNGLNNINGLTLEGLNIGQLYCNYGNINNMTIKHCWISDLYNSSSPVYSNVLIEDCIIESFTCPNTYSNFNITNCNLKSFSAHTKNISNTMAVTNCYVKSTNVNPVCQFNNCIISGTTKPNSSCTAYNCVTEKGMLDNILDKEGNYEVESIDSIFVKYYATDWANYYKLTDEAAATYLGQDGTQVGIYGGLRPFTPVPSYPLITEKSIAGQTTTDGKLRVYVKAEAQKK